LEISDENDETPTFAYVAYTFGTFENQPAGTEVGTMAALDRDLPPYNEVEYQLQGNDAFQIGHYSGRITAKSPLDRETKSEYHLRVVASQRGITGSSMAAVKIVVADRNDNQPRFLFPAVANDSVTVARCRAGAPVVRIIARDVDIGANAALRYQLIRDLPRVGNQAAFAINPLSGIVTVRKILDNAEYLLHVQVRTRCILEILTFCSINSSEYLTPVCM